MMGRLFKSNNPLEPSKATLILTYCILIFWAIIVLFPIYWLIITAFKLPVDVASGPKYIPFVDFSPSLHAWHEMLLENDPEFILQPYSNTILVGIASTFVSLVFGACTAYALTRFEYRPKPGLIFTFILCVALMIGLIVFDVPWKFAVAIGIALYIIVAQTIGRRFKGRMNNNDIAFWLISQRILPPVTVIIPVYILFQQLRLLDTLVALIITYCAMNLPIVIWLMRDYFQTIPLEIEESALIDGASRYQVLAMIVLPLSLPGLIATSVIILVFSWNEYVLALFLTGAQTQTMPILVSAQNGVRGPQWWNMSVLVMLMVGPLLILTILLERYIQKGLLVGAVKG